MYSPQPSLSPAPVLPARVSALRDPSISARRKSVPEPKTKSTPTGRNGNNRRSTLVEQEEAGSKAQRRKRTVSAQNEKEQPRQTRSRKHTLDPLTDQPQPHPLSMLENRNITSFDTNDTPLEATAAAALEPPQLSSPPSREPFFPPLAPSGIPCLLEAATRREVALEETTAAHAKVEAAAKASNDNGHKASRFIAREKTRTSGRLDIVQPFGMPFPPVLEFKSEVSGKIVELCQEYTC